MGTIVQRGVIVLLVALFLYIILRIFVIIPRRQAELFGDMESFAARFLDVQKKCDESGLKEFMKFLDEYRGSRIIRDRGKLVMQEFSSREKDELKEFYLKKVLVSDSVSPDTKNAFKECLLSIGVENLD